MPKLINLKEKFSEYQIIRDPAAKYAKKVDPMYWNIKCQYGEIFPYGGDYLAVMVTGVRIANQMRKWPELEITQDAEDAVIFKFHIKHHKKVFKKVQAKKKKVLSEEHRGKAARASREYREEVSLERENRPKKRRKTRGRCKD